MVQTIRNTVKTGLVLEGGGMRGMYTDGILDVFLDQGLSFDGVIGVSAGAIHGSSFVSGQRGRSIRYYKKYIRDNRFISMRNLVQTGDIAEVQFCYHDRRRSLIFTITMPSTVLKRSFMQSAAMWRLESRSISALQI